MYIIYGQPNCRWCDLAKELLDGIHIYKDIREPIHMKDFLLDFPGAKSVPRIKEIDDKGFTLAEFNSYEELLQYFE